MKKKKTKYDPDEDFFVYAKRVMGDESYNRSMKRAEKLSDEIRLKMVREMIGKNQTDLKGMTQPEVSKIEARKDMKISTLKKYAEALGMRVQINLIYEEDDRNQTISIYG